MAALDAKLRRLHNNLLYTTIAIDYLHSAVDNGIPESRFRANVKHYVTDPLTNSARDVTAILEILERRGLIGPGDYDILKDMVEFDQRLINEIVETENKIQNHGGSIYRRGENRYAGKRKEPCFDRGKILFY